MLSGLADVNVDARITAGLRQQGMDVATAQEQGFAQLDDEALLAAALLQRRLLLTSDTDFQAIAAEHQRQGEIFAPILYWPQNRRGIGDAIRRVILMASQRDYDASCSQVFFL
jgi:hypothetical protein